MRDYKRNLWFNTPDTETLCRGGGNGPDHPSQLYAIKKYVKFGMSLLDFGCGSGTTFEALGKANLLPYILYVGTDVIVKNIQWCRKRFPSGEWEINPSLNQIEQLNESYDVVYSRHVVDHMRSFESAMDEHCRVAKKLVIVTLWIALGSSGEHRIENIKANGKTYRYEYENQYDREKVMHYLHNKKGWKLLEIKEHVRSDKGSSASDDTIIVMERV